MFRADVLGADSRTAAMVDTRHVARLFEEHRSGAQDHAYALWAVWMLERWARQRRVSTGGRAIQAVGGAA